jgi:hypothetical protein
MFKPFFIHKHHNPGKLPNKRARGFTMLIQPHDNAGMEKDPFYVEVSVAFCSPKDEFRKSEGRSVSAAAEKKVLPMRRVPRLLVELAKLSGIHTEERDWNYVYRHML